MSWPLLLPPTNPGPDLRLAGRKGGNLEGHAQPAVSVFGIPHAPG